jgi:L-cysteine desulfidase
MDASGDEVGMGTLVAGRIEEVEALSAVLRRLSGLVIVSEDSPRAARLLRLREAEGWFAVEAAALRALGALTVADDNGVDARALEESVAASSSLEEEEDEE